MIGSLNADLLKIYKRSSNWILLGILLAFVVFILYVAEYLVYKNPPAGFRTGTVPTSLLITETFPQNLIPHLMSGISTIGAAIVLCIGALSTASEYNWITVQTILVQGPNRRAVLGGKFIALAIVSLIVTLSLFVAAALTSLILVSFNGSPAFWPSTPDLLRGFAAAWCILGVYTAFGMVLGVLLRSPAAAIGGGITYVFVVEGLLTELLANTGIVKEILRFLPGVAATGVTRVFPYTFVGLAQAPALVDGTRGSIMLLAWMVVCVVVGLAVFQRRDVGA
jgi:ABC-2 type transport system permease protein